MIQPSNPMLRVCSPAVSRILSVTTVLACAGALGAQAVVPSNALTTDANSVGRVAGFAHRMRQQFCVHSRLLTALDGKSIRMLRFRRNYSLGTAYRASTAELKVWIGTSSVAPAGASSTFSRNQGTTSVPAFSGRVSLPASAAVVASPSWIPSHTVVVPLTHPVPYQSGKHLVVELQGRPIQAPVDYAWSVDFQYSADLGSITRFGSACSKSGFAQTLLANDGGTVAGGTVRFSARGQRATPGVLMIAPSRLPSGLALDSLGMPGCWLYLQPVLQVPLTYGTANSIAPYPAARPMVDLPRGLGVLGSRIFAQAANLEHASQRSNRLGVTTTNGIDIRISSVLPNPGVTTIASDPLLPGAAMPGRGVIWHGYGPVLRLDT